MPTFCRQTGRMEACPDSQANAAAWVAVAVDQRPDDLRRAMAELQRLAEAEAVA